MKNSLGILLSGIIIANAASGESLFTGSGQLPTVPAKTLGGQNNLPPGLADAPAELKTILGDPSQIERYLATNPTSIYAPALRNTLASEYRSAGRITPALNHWSTTWQELKSATNKESYNEASHALAGQLELLTSLGRVETLHDLLKSAQDRTLTDPEDRRRLEAAREGYVTMRQNPALNYRCGTLVLAEIARTQGKPASVINALIEDPSPKEGISLLRLVQLSRQFDLGMVAVKRTDRTPLPVPSIVHWSQNHYGALMDYRQNLGAYRVIFGEPNRWMSAPDIDSEASGYFLIPANQRPANWPIVSDEECETVLGRSYIYSIDDTKDKGCKVNPTSPNAKCPTCPDVKGMPAWWVTEPYINVFLADEPVSYVTSRGEEMAFRITVKQRDSLGTVFSYPRPGFLHNWYSRIYIKGMPVTMAVTNSFASWTATADLGTGGQVTYNYNSSSNWTSSYDEETKTTLQPAYGVLADGIQYPIPGYPFGGTGVSPVWNNAPPAGTSSELNYPFWNDAASGFRVFHPDGSVDRFGLIYWQANATSGFYECEALLTQRSDPIGNDVNFNYELYTNTLGKSNFRLKQVVDYDNKTNTITYISSTSGLIQKVTTPYNQTATFAYDASGNLTNITDAVTNSSGIKWDASGRVYALNTPYGTTSFNYYDWDFGSTNDAFLDGHDSVNRAVTVTDANAGNQIYLYRFDGSSKLPDQQFSGGVVPQGTPLGTLDIGANEISHDYAAATWRNSFHWDTRQCAALSTLAVTNLSSSDYLKARRKHWLGDANNVSQTGLLSVEQEPSPDGTTPGQLTFYDYQGKTLSYLQGTNSQVAVVARRQPSGNTEYDWKQFNAAGYVTKDISTYTLADNVVRTRTNAFVYATNTISFGLVNNPAGSLFGVVFYLNDGAADASGNPAAPLFDVNETSTNTCGAWSLASTPTSSVSYANLLIASIDASGATNSYGGFPSISKTTPIHTYTAWQASTLWVKNNWVQSVTKTYKLPLPTKITNALGYVTSRTFDANNRVTSVRSPAGLTTTNNFDVAGFLAKVTDLELGRTNAITYTNGLIVTALNERGVTTTYTWDKLSRLITQSDSDGYTSNVYSRLDLVASRDKLGNWTYFGYDPLQHLVAITNANQEVTLASYCSCGALNWTRDPMGFYTTNNYDLAGRLTSVQYPDNYAFTNTFNSLDQLTMTADAGGYVANTFNLQGQVTAAANGLGLIRSRSFDILDRPQTVTDSRNVTTVLTYDAIDRVLTNAVIGVETNSFVYAASGLVQATDGLRTNLTRLQNDLLGRVLLRTNANNEVTQFQYDSSGNLTNLVDGKLQKTTFQFDAFGRITNKLDNTQVSVLQVTYDVASRVKTRWTPAKGTKTIIRDSVGRVRTNSYPSNPQVVFSYDKDGRRTNLVDGLGATASTYSPAGQLLTEGGLWANDTVTRTYNNRLRFTLTLNAQTTVYGFDAARRLYSVIGVGGSFAYNYNPGSYSSPLVKTLNLPYGMSITNGFDLAGRMSATVLLNSNLVVLDSEKYGFDADDRRTTQTRTDNSTVAYTYDGIGQLKTASAKEAGSTTRLNEQFGYSFDAAGNLNVRTNNTLTLTLGVNSLNQLTTATRAGMLTAAGNTAQAATSVKVNGQNSALYGDKTFATTAGLNLNNGANAFTTVVQYATQTFTNLATLQLPTPVTFLSDANGNLTNDGLRSLNYDDENQLVNVTVAGLFKSDFVYDGLGRRRIARDYSWNNSWNLTSEVRFIYDGNVVMQERDTNNNVLVTYDRGLDLSGTLQGAGGVGGLLARTDIKGTVYYHSDGLGNVTMLVDRYQTLEAKYLYDPFGNIVGKWGGYADVNRYRFSSKEYLPLAGLYYFGGRYYDPNLQRFINADPIRELGGVNLYGFNRNNPLRYVDPLGLSAWTDFGDWELNKLQKFREFFTGRPCDIKLDPNSLLALSNAAGVGNTALTDRNGNEVPAVDLALDVFTQPLIALSGGIGDAAELATIGREAAVGGEAAIAAKNALATGADEAVFWSGIGKGGDAKAAAWVARNGGATLETTLASRGVTLPAWDAGNSSVVAAWRQSSVDFAAGASGNIRVLQGDALGTKPIWKDEFNALKANSSVNSIRAVNPDTGSEVLLWKR